MSVPKVLVVDDEPAIRSLVAKIVGRSGLAVDTAVDGIDAIDKLEQTDYAVVVLDLMMPRADGFAVIAHVKAMAGPHPALIVASAGDTSILRRLDGTVVHSILRKPFEIDILGDLIVAAASSVAAEREREASGVVEFRSRSKKAE